MHCKINYNFVFQKCKNAIKSDLFEKCPKCGQRECDCFPPEENEPMLVLQAPDFKQTNIVSNLIPYGVNQTTHSAPISRNLTDITLNGHTENGNRTLPR